MNKDDEYGLEDLSEIIPPVSSRSLKKNNKGFFSVLWVIVIIISCFMIAGLVGVIQRQYVITEVRGIMDVAGVSALAYSVDKEVLRGDKFAYNKDKLLGRYREIMNERITKTGVITDMKFVKTEVFYEKSNNGLGQSAVATPDQLWLDSVIVITIKSFSPFDQESLYSHAFYDSKHGNNFTVTYRGKTEDGRIELMIRSVSRIVYR